MKLALILSLIVWIIAILVYLLFFKKKKNLKINIITAFLACIISIMILVFPFLEYDKLDLKILMSFIIAIKCAVMNQDIDFLSNINLNTWLGHLYFILVNVLFLITPALTVSFVISYLEKLVDHIKFSLSKNKKTIIFSELNDKSLILARDYENDKNCSIVFANVKEKSDIKIKSINLLERVTDIKVNPTNDVTFYIISKDEEKKEVCIINTEIRNDFDLYHCIFLPRILRYWTVISLSLHQSWQYSCQVRGHETRQDLERATHRAPGQTQLLPALCACLG